MKVSEHPDFERVNIAIIRRNGIREKVPVLRNQG